MEDKMKIDISNLIGDLVEATVRSLKEDPDYEEFLKQKIVTRNYANGKKDMVSVRTALNYAQGGQMDADQSASYSQAIGLIDKEANKKNSGFKPEDLPDSVQDEIEKFKKQAQDQEAGQAGDKEGTEKKKKTKKASDVDKKTDSEIEKLVGDEGGEEEKEYNKEEAEEKLSDAGFTKGKVSGEVNKGDPSIQKAVKNGFKKNEKDDYNPAPGNAGSLMNEVFSTVGVNMVREMRPPPPTPEQLKEEIMRLYGNTAAITGISKKVRDQQVLLAAEAALAKNTVIDDVIENNSNFGENTEVVSYYGSATSLQQQYDLLQGMKGKKPPTILYNDKGEVITRPPNDIRTVRQVLGWTNPETGNKFTAAEVKKLLEDQTPEGALEFLSLAALNGGGGGNPSDTAHIIRDDNHLTFMGYSDKQSLNDQQANSTPAQLLREYKETVEYLESIGYKFNDEQKKKIDEQITKMEKEFADAERELSRAALSPAREMADQMLDGGENSEAIMAVINDPAVAGVGGSGKADDRRNYIDKINENSKVGNQTTLGEIQIDPEDENGIPTWGEYLRQAGVKEGEEPTQEQKVAAMLLLRADETEVSVIIDGKKTQMPRGQLFATTNSNRIMGELTQRLQSQEGYSVEDSTLSDYGNRLEEARQKSIEALQDGVENLNKMSVKDNEGVESKLGDIMAGSDIVEKLHLYAIDGEDAPGLYGWGMIRLVAGPHIVDGAALRECTGAENSDELIKRMRARPPKEDGPTLPGSNLRESQLQRARANQSPARTRGGDYVYLTKDDKYWYGKDDDDQKPKGAKQLGMITGQKALLVLADKEGKEVEIGVQTFRSKVGQSGKLGTSYSFSQFLQDCLASKNKD